MTNKEKVAIIAALEAGLHIINSTATKDSSPDLPVPPPIGPMYDGVRIATRLDDLPFDEQEVLSVIGQVEEAIRTESRMAGLADNAVYVLSTLRQLLPLLLAL